MSKVELLPFCRQFSRPKREGSSRLGLREPSNHCEGWPPLRLPAVRSSEEWALSLLEQQSVSIHLGSFFGFDAEAYLVVSLLTPEARFDEGIRRLLQAL